MLEPKDCPLTLSNGTERTFVLSKFPAIQGREIVTQYPISAMPKIGDYPQNQALMLKVLAFVGVRLEGREDPLMLTTAALVDNHVGDWETLARLEWAMLEYNCSFFGNGLNSGSFAGLLEKAKPLISQMLTALSAQSLQTEKQPSTN